VSAPPSTTPLDGPVWYPYAFDPFPGPRTRWAAAEGCYAIDEKGRRYFDATSSWWCKSFGHRHPRLVAALERQLARFDHLMMSPHAHDAAEQFADRLVALAGRTTYERVFFTDDGSTAVEAAMKMALQYWRLVGQPRRTRFAAVELGYHGDTLGALSVGHIEEFHGNFASYQRDTLRAKAPYCYRCPVGLSYPGCEIACVDDFEKRLAAEGDTIAAFVVEPLVLGAGGMIVYPTEALERLVRLARRAGALVLFDEVFTGFGRTGKTFAFQHLSDDPELRPDLVALSKGLTAGMLPLGAVVARRGLYDAFRGPGRLSHGHTFAGHALGCAVGLEAARMLEEEETRQAIAGIARLFEDAEPMFRGLAAVGDVRRLGALFALELVTNKSTKSLPTPANGPGWRLAWKLWERGFWLRPLQQMLYVVPPFTSDLSTLHQLLTLLYTELRHGIGPESGAPPAPNPTEKGAPS
jgi:adenosylmethionine-8-amino-7-oxononanoate aminotransferase